MLLGGETLGKLFSNDNPNRKSSPLVLNTARVMVVVGEPWMKLLFHKGKVFLLHYLFSFKRFFSGEEKEKLSLKVSRKKRKKDKSKDLWDFCLVMKHRRRIKTLIFTICCLNRSHVSRRLRNFCLSFPHETKLHLNDYEKRINH